MSIINFIEKLFNIKKAELNAVIEKSIDPKIRLELARQDFKRFQRRKQFDSNSHAEVI